MSEAMLKRLFSKVTCGICGQRYDVSNIKVLDNEDGVWFLSLVCTSCGTRGLIAAVVGEGTAIDTASDLSEAEYERFADSELVGVDDVLDMHCFLKNFNGDFTSLFSNE